MTLLQLAFLAGMTLVTVAILAFTYLVVAGARAADGGAFLSVALLRRLGRSSYERSELNRWAFYAHRISGFAIFAFLALHIFDVAAYALSPAAFNEIHGLYSTAPMRVFECGLLLGLLFHALNGLRLFAVDLWDLGPSTATRCLYVVLATTVLFAGLGSGVILRPLAT